MKIQPTKKIDITDEEYEIKQFNEPNINSFDKTDISMYEKLSRKETLKVDDIINNIQGKLNGYEHTTDLNNIIRIIIKYIHIDGNVKNKNIRLINNDIEYYYKNNWIKASENYDEFKKLFINNMQLFSNKIVKITRNEKYDGNRIALNLTKELKQALFKDGRNPFIESYKTLNEILFRYINMELTSIVKFVRMYSFIK